MWSCIRFAGGTDHREESLLRPLRQKGRHSGPFCPFVSLSGSDLGSSCQYRQPHDSHQASLRVNRVLGRCFLRQLCSASVTHTELFMKSTGLPSYPCCCRLLSRLELNHSALKLDSCNRAVTAPAERVYSCAKALRKMTRSRMFIHITFGSCLAGKECRQRHGIVIANFFYTNMRYPSASLNRT